MNERALICALLVIAACSDDASSVKGACDDACTQLRSCDDQSDADQCPDICAATAPALAASNCESSGTAAYRCIADKNVCDLDDDDGICAELFTTFSTCIGQLCASDTTNPICFAQSHNECMSDCSAEANCADTSASGCDDSCERDNLTAAAADCRAEVDALYACKAAAPDRCDTATHCANEQAARDACMAPYCSKHRDARSTLCAER